MSSRSMGVMKSTVTASNTECTRLIARVLDFMRALDVIVEGCRGPYSFQ